MTLELADRAASFPARVAIIDQAGPHSFAELENTSASVAARLLEDQPDLEEGRVAFMVDPSFDYASVQWGIWRAGGVAVPLCLSHPPAELAYVLDDARPKVVVADSKHGAILQPLAAERAIRFLRTAELDALRRALPAIESTRRAMMLYTSGTTGRPKGVVTTHDNIAAQIKSLVEAWEWETADRILLTLPLHHVHGIVNVLSCALWTGASCEMGPALGADEIWSRLSGGDLTLYMAVPTIYHRLIEEWNRADSRQQRLWSQVRHRLRLMVSGSAALPVPLLERWREISGHTLLERYGMTEIGMALSNPYRGERVPGSVGRPLPGVEARLVDEGGQPVGNGVAGELQIRGENVFLDYWDRPEATNASFTSDRWFRTGDIAICDDGLFRILGRASVDIIKTGGEKVSALEIEEVLLAHDQVSECAVVGLDDPEWGQRVVAAVVPLAGQIPTADSLRAWCRERLAPYKVPKSWHLLAGLPRNAMGKVTKPEVVKMLGDRS